LAGDSGSSEINRPLLFILGDPIKLLTFDADCGLSTKCFGWELPVFDFAFGPKLSEELESGGLLALAKKDFLIA